MQHLKVVVVMCSNVVNKTAVLIIAVLTVCVIIGAADV